MHFLKVAGHSDEAALASPRAALSSSVSADKDSQLLRWACKRAQEGPRFADDAESKSLGTVLASSCAVPVTEKMTLCNSERLPAETSEIMA